MHNTIIKIKKEDLNRKLLLELLLLLPPAELRTHRRKMKKTKVEMKLNQTMLEERNRIPQDLELENFR